ncbi:hypothetical protein K8W59_17990 [Nocardioides rotundus]|uniref:hypothetical protein n=1 Tax=Nocardioides rotundus TaxID=1774216 RepID=UPI001CBE247C|nr:hypothetical protein [Nocardioides rotundus]UAL29607.1 hypothetical protein K8W59_17990 [Nocardioides rotundus]
MPRDSSLRARGPRWAGLVLWAVLLLGGAGLLLAALVGAVAPSWIPRRVGLDGGGATLVVAALAWALAVRVGGNPLIGAGLAALLAVGALTSGWGDLRASAAVLAAVLGAVLGVMATRPATTFVTALREVVVALVFAALGGLAAVGFRPTLDLLRYEYAVLALAFVLLVVLVHRLGAGFHGLGARGLLVVLVALLVVTVTLAYSELVRAYGTPGVTGSMRDLGAWSRETLGGVPRPLQAILGVPALVWGCHLRTRRRQGWWVCAFGVAATAPLATEIADPDVGAGDVVVTQVLSVLIGMLIAYVVIRIDLLLTGGSSGRRARRATEVPAPRPEPARTRALL